MQIDELIILIKGQLKNAAVFSNVDRRMAQTEKRAHRLRNAFGGLFSIGGLTGGIGGIFAVKGFINTARHVDRIQTRFETITGTMEGVNSLFKESGRIANSYGLDLQTTEEGLSMLLGSMKGSSFTMQEGIEMYDNISRAVAGMKLSTEEAKGALLAFSQIISKGKVQAEELRRQLANRMPGAFPIAAQALFPGLSGDLASAKLDQSLRDGSVTSKALIKIAKALADNFGKNAEKAANGVIGSVHRMGNAWEEFKRKVTAGGFGQGIIKFSNAITKLLNGKDLEVIATAIGKTIGLIADNMPLIINGIKIALLFFAGGRLLKGLAVVRAFSFSIIKIVKDLSVANAITDVMMAKTVAKGGMLPMTVVWMFKIKKAIIALGFSARAAAAMATGGISILVSLLSFALTSAILAIADNWDKVVKKIKEAIDALQRFEDKQLGITRKKVTYDPNKLTDFEYHMLQDMIKSGTTDVMNKKFVEYMNKAGANIKSGTIAATYNNNSNVTINNELNTNNPDVADKFIKELPDDIQKAQKDYESAH